MHLSKENFRKAKTVNFSNIIDDLEDIVNVAMDDAGISDEHFCSVHGTEMRDNKTDEVLCKVAVVDIVNGVIFLECNNGTTYIPLNTFN